MTKAFNSHRMRLTPFDRKESLMRLSQCVVGEYAKRSRRLLLPHAFGREQNRDQYELINQLSVGPPCSSRSAIAGLKLFQQVLLTI